MADADSADSAERPPDAVAADGPAHAPSPLARRSELEPEPLRVADTPWRLPLLATLAGFALTAVLAWVLAGQRAFHADLEAQLRADHLQTQLVDGVALHAEALGRLADHHLSAGSRSAARRLFEVDARLYLRDFGSFDAIRLVSPEMRVIAAQARGGPDPLLGQRLDTSEARAEAFAQARQWRGMQLSAPLPLHDAQLGALLIVPMFDGDRLEGYVVCSFVYQTLVPRLLHGTVRQPMLLLAEDQTLYRSGEPEGAPVATRTVSLLGQSWRLQLWPETADAYALLVPAVIAGGTSLSLLIGAVLWFAGVARRRAEHGTAQALALHRAQLQKYGALHALRESEQELSGLLDNISDAFLTLDAEMRVIDLNRRAQRALGQTQASARGRPIGELFPPLERDAAFAQVAEAIAARQAIDTDVFHAGADRWLEVRVLPRASDLAVYVRDITSRKRAELEILQREELQARAQRLARFGSWEFDIERSRLTWSDQLLQILGLAREDMSGDPEQIFDFIHADDAPRVRATVEALFGGATNVPLSYRLVRADGELREIEEIATTQCNEAGQVVVLTGVLRDVTDERRLQRLDEQQRDILQHIAQRQPLQDCLARVAAIIAEHVQGAQCAILARSEDGRRLRVGAAEGLSEEVCAALDAAPLGVASGAWSTLINDAKAVIVEDVGADPRWATHRELVLANGCRAHWSMPVVSTDGEMRGSLTLFFAERRRPREGEWTLLERMATLTGIALAQADAHARLAGSEQRFRSLFDQHPDGVAVLDQDGIFRLANASHERVTGIASPLLLGLAIGEMPWPVERRERTRDAFVAALNGRATRFEFVEARGRGELAWIETAMMPIVVDGRVEGAFATVRDLSDLRRAEQHLLERDQFFELSVEAFCILEPETDQLLQVNPALARMLGYAAPVLQGRRLSDFMRSDERAAAREAFQRMLAGDRSATATVRFTTADGQALWLEFSARRAPDGRVFGAARDITARRQAEQALEQTLTDLRARNQELADFAFVASHDLQEPLRKIRAFSDRMLARYAEQVDEQGRFYLERVNGSAERMQALLDNLLAYSRVTTQTRPFEAVNLNVVVANVMLDLETRVEATDARVRIGQLPTVSGDAVQLRQLFQNLLANALKFVVAGRRPVIAVLATPDARPGGGWVIEVTDNGVGFAPEYAERLFGPFQRLHARGEYEGVGMGLAIAKRIAERHGGRISATAAEDAGATFTLYLPDAMPQIAANA